MGRNSRSEQSAEERVTMAEHLFDLTGRLAVVTGARRGIGAAIAAGLAEAGADIVGVSANLESEGSEIAKRIEGLGRSFTAIRADFGDRAAVADLAVRLAELDRPVDILVNNAGTIRRAPAAEHGDEDWDHVLQVNLSSQFVLAREVGRGMIERGSGKIIFTASLLSFQGGINVPGYTAAKSGIAGLTRALANEWASKGVNVNAIAPGYIDTDNTEALRADPQRNRAIVERIPAGRWGAADDLAGAAVFLASAASDYVHGITLPVDGGWLGR
jgi:2-deoxy-D-gluconate 3-dehydrogenase